MLLLVALFDLIELLKHNALKHHPRVLFRKIKKMKILWSSWMNSLQKEQVGGSSEYRLHLSLGLPKKSNKKVHNIMINKTIHHIIML